MGYANPGFPGFGGSMGFPEIPDWMGDVCLSSRHDICCGKDANTCGTAFGCAWASGKGKGSRSLQQYFTPKPEPDGVVGAYTEDGCWPEPEVHPLCTFNATAARTALGLIKGMTSARRLQQFNFPLAPPMPGFGDSPNPVGSFPEVDLPGFGDSPSTGGNPFDFPEDGLPGFGDSPNPFGSFPEVDLPGFGSSPSTAMPQELEELESLLERSARFPMQCCTKDAAACNQTTMCTYEGGACWPTDPQFNDWTGEGGASPPWGATGMPGSGASPPWDGTGMPTNATVNFMFSFSAGDESNDLEDMEDKFASIFSKASKIPMDRIEVQIKREANAMGTLTRKLSQYENAPKSWSIFTVEVSILAESASQGRMVVKALTEGVLLGSMLTGYPMLEKALKDEGLVFGSASLVKKPEMKPGKGGDPWDGTGMPGSGASPPWDGTGMPGSGASPPWDGTGMPGSGASPPWDGTGMPTKPAGPECAERMVRAPAGPSPTSLSGPTWCPPATGRSDHWPRSVRFTEPQ